MPSFEKGEELVNSETYKGIQANYGWRGTTDYIDIYYKGQLIF
jgi:hypothetical protein